MNEELNKAEKDAREALQDLTGSWEGWPNTEDEWQHLRKTARALHFACELRAGLLVINES